MGRTVSARPRTHPAASLELTKGLHPGPYAMLPLGLLSGVWVYVTDLSSVNDETVRPIE